MCNEINFLGTALNSIKINANKYINTDNKRSRLYKVTLGLKKN